MMSFSHYFMTGSLRRVKTVKKNVSSLAFFSSLVVPIRGINNSSAFHYHRKSLCECPKYMMNRFITTSSDDTVIEIDRDIEKYMEKVHDTVIEIDRGIEKYMKKVHEYVCNNGGEMDLGAIWKVSHSGIERPSILNDKKIGAVKIFEMHGQSYFKLRRNEGGACFVRAIPKETSINILIPNNLINESHVPKINESTLKSKATGRSFAIDNGTKCHYITNLSDAETTLNGILKCLSGSISATDASQFISVDCEGLKNGDLQLIQIATAEGVYIFDCQLIGRRELCRLMEPVLTQTHPIKLMHDLTDDAIVFDKFGDIELVGALDTQLLAEFLWNEPFVGFNELLSRLDLPEHPTKKIMGNRMDTNKDLWCDRPLAKESLRYAAMDVSLLQNMAIKISSIVGSSNMIELMNASRLKIKNSIKHQGSRKICFDRIGNYNLASFELVNTIRPEDGFFGEKLNVHCNIAEVLAVLPDSYKEKILIDSDMNAKERLSDIVLDINRRPQCWIKDSRVFLCDDESEVVKEKDVELVVSNLGKFGSDDRAGLARQLHRFSAVRNREGHINGLTIRIGRHVSGNAAMLMDLLMTTNKSILILGEPGSGKTTIIREAASKLAEVSNVMVVDTSNEIAGDGTDPHECIGLARRIMVPSKNKQAEIMVNVVQNHTPHIMVIDEIGRPREVQAANTVKNRGVRMIASAHGDLRSLLKNKDLVGLIGGLERSTIGDDAAWKELKRRKQLMLGQDGEIFSNSVTKTKVERAGSPTFEIIVEVSRESQHSWRIVNCSATAVDAILSGRKYKAHRRRRDPDTGEMFMDFIDA